MSTPYRPDLDPALIGNPSPRVADRLMDKLEESSGRVQQIPVWRIVATAPARRVNGGVQIRCVNDLGHAIDLFFKTDDWAWAQGGAA